MSGPGARAELEYREVPPVAPLAPFVRRYWVLRGVAPVGHLRRILPDGCADVLFEVVDGGTPRGRWIGVMTRPFEARLEGLVDLFGVRFEPGGLHALAGLPLHPFTDGEVPVESADPLGLGMLGEAVAGAPSFEARCAAADRALFLAACARGASPPRLGGLLLRLAAAPFLPRVPDLARAAGVSERTLERRFLDAVGVGPKAHLRWVRFERARSLIARGDSSGAAGLYADQAHFIREFRAFAGETPGAWALRRAVSEIFKPGLRRDGIVGASAL